MSIEQIAKKLWEDCFGNNEWAQDCFGTWMHRDAHGDQAVLLDRTGLGKKYDYSWNVDHIRPKSSYTSEGDADFFNNYEPMHRLNNQEKSDNYPHFTIAKKRFSVVKFGNSYGIVNTYGQRIDWKGTKNKIYT